MHHATNERPLRIRRVMTCVCGQHAIIRLDPLAGGSPVYARTTIDLAAALHAADIALPTAAAACVRSLLECLRSTGSVPVAVVLARRQHEVRLRLAASIVGASTEVHIEPGVGLLAAKLLGIKLVLRDTPGAAPAVHDDDDVPLVFHELLASLDFQDEVAPDVRDEA